MKKPVIGLLLGAVLGAFDGLTALGTPEVASEIVGIVIGSTIKGIVVGALVGWYSLSGPVAVERAPGRPRRRRVFRVSCRGNSAAQWPPLLGRDHAARIDRRSDCRVCDSEVRAGARHRRALNRPASIVHWPVRHAISCCQPSAWLSWRRPSAPPCAQTCARASRPSWLFWHPSSPWALSWRPSSASPP